MITILLRTSENGKFLMRMEQEDARKDRGCDADCVLLKLSRNEGDRRRKQRILVVATRRRH